MKTTINTKTEFELMQAENRELYKQLAAAYKKISDLTDDLIMLKYGTSDANLVAEFFEANK